MPIGFPQEFRWTIAKEIVETIIGDKKILKNVMSAFARS